MTDTPPRDLPRFIPTLTEVVDAAGLIRKSVPLAPDSEEIAQAVMQQIQALIERRLSEEIDAMVRALMAEQLPSLRLRLRQELELSVRQAVLEAITRRSQAKN